MPWDSSLIEPMSQSLLSSSLIEDGQIDVTEYGAYIDPKTGEEKGGKTTTYFVKLIKASDSTERMTDEIGVETDSKVFFSVPRQPGLGDVSQDDVGAGRVTITVWKDSEKTKPEKWTIEEMDKYDTHYEFRGK